MVIKLLTEHSLYQRLNNHQGQSGIRLTFTVPALHFLSPYPFVSSSWFEIASFEAQTSVTVVAHHPSVAAVAYFTLIKECLGVALLPYPFTPYPYHLPSLPLNFLMPHFLSCSLHLFASGIETYK